MQLVEVLLHNTDPYRCQPIGKKDKKLVTDLQQYRFHDTRSWNHIRVTELLTVVWLALAMNRGQVVL